MTRKKKNRATNGAIIYHGPAYPQHLKCNGGTLPDGELEIHSYCAWNFVRNAHLAILSVPGQATMEGDEDQTVRLRDLLDSNLQIYGIEDANEVMRLMPECRLLTFKLNRTWSDRLQAWIDSGGRAYNKVTREPDAI